MRSRQRQAPPFDRSPRRGDQSGGPIRPITRRTLANTIDDQTDRYPGYRYDDQIQRDRGPSWHRQWMNSGRSSGLVDWTAAGPVRPELHMHNATLRLMQGNSNTRNMPDPNNMQRGIHTNPPAAQVTAGGRYQQTQQMVKPRQNRLRSGQYTGQSFSETTQMQGAPLAGRKRR